MNNHDEKPKRKSMFERVLLDNFDFFNPRNDAEEILSQDLDHPDWHLKYARNIIYLILFFTISASVTSFIFPSYYDTLGQFSASIRGLVLGFALFIASICGIFDEMMDQESDEVRWFNYARFWFVILSIGGFTLFIAIKAANSGGF